MECNLNQKDRRSPRKSDKIEVGEKCARFYEFDFLAPFVLPLTQINFLPPGKTLDTQKCV